jgi:hypothetical protein
LIVLGAGGDFGRIIEQQLKTVGFIDEGGDFATDVWPDLNAQQVVFNGDGLGHGGDSPEKRGLTGEKNNFAPFSFYPLQGRCGYRIV